MKKSLVDWDKKKHGLIWKIENVFSDTEQLGQYLVYGHCDESGTDTHWVYDFENSNLIKKIEYFIDKYNESVDKQDMNLSIKWTYSLEDFFKRKEKI